MTTRTENQPGIREVYDSILGRVPDGTLTRALTIGKIPEWGPGRHSIPRALQAIKETEMRVKRETAGHVPVMRTKEDRRSWNLNNTISTKRK